MNDGMDGMGPVLATLIVGMIFGLILGVSVTKAFYREEAIKGKHAIYAPDTGRFMWLQPGDQVTR